jgi:hypothetical protein
MSKKQQKFSIFSHFLSILFKVDLVVALKRFSEVLVSIVW